MENMRDANSDEECDSIPASKKKRDIKGYHKNKKTSDQVLFKSASPSRVPTVLQQPPKPSKRLTRRVEGQGYEAYKRQELSKVREIVSRDSLELTRSQMRRNYSRRASAGEGCKH